MPEAGDDAVPVGTSADGNEDRASPIRGGEREVLRVSATGVARIAALLAPAGLVVETVADGRPIPGSHWGEEEAGLIGSTLYLRPDTPVHSALHEGGHWLLMDESRRARLHTDAGGTAREESAVCCLQILLADHVGGGMTRARMIADMDRWGYTFRLGSTARWFAEDADDARALLHERRERLAAVPCDIDPRDRRVATGPD